MHCIKDGNRQCPAAAKKFKDSIFANIDAYSHRSRKDFLHLSIITTVFIFINSHSSSSKYIHVASSTCKKKTKMYKKLFMHTYLIFICIFCHVQLKKDFANFLEFNNNLKAIKRFPCTF